MDAIEQDDVLDRKLREAAPYIDDNGFTTRVLSRLPASQQKKELTLRGVILIGLTILGSALAYKLSDGGHFISVGIVRAASLPALWLLLGAAATGMLLTVAGAAAAVSNNRGWQSSD